MIRTLKEWREFAAGIQGCERGVYADMVFDILKDWQEQSTLISDLLRQQKGELCQRL